MSSATSTNSSTAASSTDEPSIDDATVPRSIARVLDLLEIVLVERNCNLTTAANASGLTPTTALRYLRALQTRGYVKRDDTGHYSAGPTMHGLAESLRGETIVQRLATTAQPHLDSLAELSGESTYLAMCDGNRATYIASAESPRAIRHVGWVGQNITLDGSAVGAAFASPGSTEIRTGAVEPDITAISRALLTSDGPNLAVSIVGPQHRFGTEQTKRHRSALDDAVVSLAQELRTHGEDVTA